MGETTTPYRRILLKLSGEGLAGDQEYGISKKALDYVIGELRAVVDMGVEVAIVVGGGNILRGGTFVKQCQISEATAHHMGMLATVINGLALQEAFALAGMDAVVFSAVPVPFVCEPYSRRAALGALAQGKIAILAGGTGRPFVTTDTAAAIGAAELDVDLLLKATQVDGVYSSDPKTDPKATLYPALGYDQVIRERLKVMDLSAVELCQHTATHIVVFNLHTPGNIRKAVQGEPVGSKVS